VAGKEDLRRLLKAVNDGDFADTPVDNQMLATALRLSLVDVAGRLQEAQARSLVSGILSGQKPGPWYTDLQVTAQGQRFLGSYRPDPTR
jgi:hypothetical protein